MCSKLWSLKSSRSLVLSYELEDNVGVKQDVKVSTGFSWLRIGSSVGLF
jgi:hypothetical protein